MTEKFG